LQKGAILFIIRHWKKYVARLKEEREEEAKVGELQSPNSKKTGRRATNSNATSKNNMAS